MASAHEHHHRNATQANASPDNPIYRRRVWINRGNLACRSARWRSAWCSVVDFAVLFSKGFSAVGTAMFTQMTPPPGSDDGLPTRLSAADHRRCRHLHRHADRHPSPAFISPRSGVREMARLTCFINDILLSAPSIVIGLLCSPMIVANVKHYSAWAGAVALAIIAVPVIVRQTENMLQLVPSLREAVCCVGRAAVARGVDGNAASGHLGGVVTGVLLALARIAGETALLLFTALNNQFWSADLNARWANLPVVIFQFAMSPYEEWAAAGVGGALLDHASGTAAQYRGANAFPARQTLSARQPNH